MGWKSIGEGTRMGFCGVRGLPRVPEKGAGDDRGFLGSQDRVLWGEGSAGFLEIGAWDERAVRKPHLQVGAQGERVARWSYELGCRLRGLQIIPKWGTG